MDSDGDAGLLERLGAELVVLGPLVDERARRLVLGAVARAAGEGGTGRVARLAGASWQTVAGGAAELESGLTAAPGRVRRAGGGRKKLAETDPGLRPALLALVEESVRGDPESLLTWTTKSVQHLSDELERLGHRCSPQTAWRLLGELGFSMQANAKVKEGRQHPDRDAQFRYVSDRAKAFMAAGDPVISVDAKKREAVGEFARPGREWAPEGQPVRVRDHSFEDRDGGHAIPYGIYDIAANAGFVNVGTGSNTGVCQISGVRAFLVSLFVPCERDACPRCLLCLFALSVSPAAVPVH